MAGNSEEGIIKMITPEYLQEIMDAVEEELVNVDNYILEKIAKRIVETFERSGDILIPSSKADIRKLLMNGVLYEDIQNALEKKLPEIQGIIREAFYNSADEIMVQNIEFANQLIEVANLRNVDIPSFERAGITRKASELGMTKLEIRHLEEAYRRTNGEMKNLTKTMPMMAVKGYENACDMAYMKVKSGVSVQTAIVEAIKDVSKQGSTVYYQNREDNVEVAIARAVRTGVNQANGNIVLTRCAEIGVPYVKASAHMGARVTKANDFTNHGYWQGKVYFLDWKNANLEGIYKDATATGSGFEWLEQMREELKEKDVENKHGYPDFVSSCGFGDIRGIFGVNCRHSVYAFYPGINLNDDDRPNMEENKKRYALDQKQRGMERSIRATKRQINALKSCGLDSIEVKEEIKALRKHLNEQSDKYLAFCKENGLKPRNMNLKV